MTNNQNEPREFDAVLGGETPPIYDAVLGGIEGIKRRLSSQFIEDREEALHDALQYGASGLDLIIQSLQDKSGKLRRYACVLLSERNEPQAITALQNYKPWFLKERWELEKRSGESFIRWHSKKFANRKVEEYNPQVGITDPVGTAYAFRTNRDGDEFIADKLELLLKDSQVGNVEALVFGMWHSDVFESDSSQKIVNFLVNSQDKLTNLKAVFIGDVTDNEGMISQMSHNYISPVLEAYPNLEILKIRGGNTHRMFNPIRHEKLKALIIETGGLRKESLLQLYSLQLPALEHLEIWLGSFNYRCTCYVEDLFPLFYGDLFPNLIYLGLRNSEYTNEIVREIVQAPVLQKIQVLDISLGNLTDEGAEFLLNYPAINQLDILNISETYVNDEMLELLWQMDVNVIAEGNRVYEYEGDRYCTVAE
ncbi:HEAT repeat domain-containing protein [Nostoc sp.]|uniref:HEAT repeat domain-containing protein n=1 Tax=Nostoc sp. TaxID=1180 RepID=UPI002FF9F9D1